LAIVAAVLAADGVFGVGELAGTVLLGELGLDGRVRSYAPATLAERVQAGTESATFLIIRRAAERKVIGAQRLRNGRWLGVTAQRLDLKSS
jgi:magnesium chelatase family protein